MKEKTKKLLRARVIARYRNKYRILLNGKELWAEITGKFRASVISQSDYPVVGDMINIVERGDGQATIDEILPRHGLLQRKVPAKDELQPIAVNIDTVFIVQAVDQDFNLNRLERYLVLAKAAKIKPIMVLNKIDLITENELSEKVEQIKGRFHNLETLVASAASRSGIKELASRIKAGEVYCFIGSSGVGKSSIINDLLGSDLIRTKEISTATKKGKHTTTHRELFVLKNGGMVIDNPGIREVGIASAKIILDDVFDDVSELAKECKFADCRHIQEPGCAVLSALKSQALSHDKYANYLKLKKESQHYAMSNIEKKSKARGLSRLIKNYKKIV